MKGQARVVATTPSEPTALTAPASETEGETDEDDPADSDEDKSPGEKAAKPPKSEARLSPIMRQIRDDEEGSLKAWLDTIGTQGAFKVQLRRAEPAFFRDPRSGRNIPVKGWLDTYDHTIDEEYIAREYGGGTYQLKVTRPDASGAFRFERGLHRTIEVAGDPRLDRLPGHVPPPQSQPAEAAQGANVIQHALDMMERMVSKKDGSQDKGLDPAVALLLEQLRAQLATGDKERADLRREISDLRNQKPPEDPFRDKMLDKFLDGDAARINAIRTQHESEIRQLKEGHIADVKRIEDRHDRAMAEVRQMNESAMSTLKSGYEREIAALRSAHEVALLSARGTAEVQVESLKGQIRSLERELTEARADVKELRERKDKPLMDQVAEINKLREAIGGDKDGDDSTTEKIVGAIPVVMEGLGQMITQVRQNHPAQAQQVQGVVQNPGNPAARPQRVIAADPRTGRRFLVQDGKIAPVKRKPQVITNEAGAQIEAPVIDPAQLAMLVPLVEGAFRSSQEPEIFAQTWRSQIPPEILNWMRDNDSEQASGVDLFMSKVARIPETSPLRSQGGKNWLRKVGKALLEGGGQ